MPLYSQLIALKEYVRLDLVFNKTLKQMVIVCLFLLILFMMIIGLLNITQLRVGHNVLADRFLPYLPIILMMIPVLLLQFVSSWANYLRCHKKEPFLANSIVSGLLCCLSTIIFGRMYGLYGVTIGYCVINIMMFPWSYWIYKTKKAEWHKLI